MSVLDLHLGIDFGTRYTKTCIRDIGREQSWVVRSGRAESYLDEALILSQVGITTQGKIIAGLTQYEWQKQTESFALKIDYIKMRLAHLDISQDNSQWYSPQIQGLQEYDLPLEEILENICAFFLFKVIQRSQAWFTESQKNLFKNMTVEWGASIGVPVAYCDSPALTRFKKVLGLAWCLNEESQLDEESQLADSLNYVNSKLMQLKRNIDLEQIPCYAIPEIAAAVSSFTNSRQAKQGVYTFFDVGGGTIEGVAFDFCPDNNGQKKIDFYAALVVTIQGSTGVCGFQALEI